MLLSSWEQKYFDWGRFWKKNYEHNENPLSWQKYINPIHWFKKHTFSVKIFLDLHQTYDTKKIIRIFSVGLNGNSAIHYFTNTCNGFQVLKQKSAIPII